MSGSGKGGNNRKNRQRFSGKRDDSQKYVKKFNQSNNHNDIFSDGKTDNKISLHERPKWTTPELPANPITTPDCPWCGKKITDITTSISDKDTGLPVHFDCVLARIAEAEKLEENDNVCYIGGGRFGIVHYNNPPETKGFTIKKIFEWEAKDAVSEWRRPISEYFSIT
jgi:hypothetical protein